MNTFFDKFPYQEGGEVKCKLVKDRLIADGYDGKKTNESIAEYLSGLYGKPVLIGKASRNNINVFLNIYCADEVKSTFDEKEALQTFGELVGSYHQSPIETYIKAIDLFNNVFDVVVRTDPTDSDFCGHKILKKAKPKPIKGIEYDENFRILRPINTNELVDIENKYIETIAYGFEADDYNACEVEDAFTLLNPIIIPGQKKDQLVTLSRRVYATDPDYLNIHTEAIDAMPKAELDNDDKAQWPIAYLPHPDWFTDSLNQLEIEDVLTIFPKAERELLALCVGRAVVGANNTIQSTTRLKIEHGMRCFPLIYGVPKIGKSTLFEFLTNALKNNGYSLQQFSYLDKQFGLAPIAQSNIAYADDLTTTSLQKVIEAPLFKQIISGGQFKAEVKHQDDIDVRATTMMFANINNFTPNILYKADNGALNRLKILSTYRDLELDERINLDLTELSKDSPNLRTYQHITWLAEKLDVSIDAIMLKFASLCAQKFFSELEHNTLETTVENWSSQLRTRLHEGFDQTLMSLLQFCWCIRRSKTNAPNLSSGSVLCEALLALNYIINDDRANDVRNLIKADWVAKGRRARHIWVAISQLDNISVALAESQARQAIHTQLKSVDFAVKLVFGELRLNSGFNLAANTAAIQRDWREALYGFKANTILINKIVTNLDEQVKQQLFDTSLGTCVSHLTNPDYDRELHADQLNQKLLKT